MSNRIAFITGASSGIGKATAIALASKKTNLILNGRDEQKLLKTKYKIDQVASEHSSLIVAGNVDDEGVIQQCLAASQAAWQRSPDIFIACAGRGLPGTLITSDESQWKELVDTNITGLWKQLKLVSVSMLAAKETVQNYQRPYDIVILGSSIGRNVSPFNSLYGATKFATHGITEALRRELGPKGIRVSLIEPGIVSTGFQEAAGYDKVWFEQYTKEIGPVLSAEDVADAIDFLIHLPGNVHIDNLSIRPTRQAYP